MSKKSLTQIQLVSVITYLKTYLNLTTKKKRVWRFLLGLHRIQGHVFPCYKTMAKMCGCCIDTACRSVKRFEEMGWLKRLRRPYCSNLYIINPRYQSIEVGPQDRIAIKSLRKYEKELFERYPPPPTDDDDEGFREEITAKSVATHDVSLSSVSLNYNRIYPTTQNVTFTTNAALHPLVMSNKYASHDLRCWSKQPEYVINQAIIKHNYIQNKVRINNQVIRNEAALMNSLIYKEAQRYKDSKSPTTPEPEAKQPIPEMPPDKELNLEYINNKNNEKIVVHNTNKKIDEIPMHAEKINVILGLTDVQIVTLFRGQPCCYRTILLDLDSARFNKMFDSLCHEVSVLTEEKNDRYKKELIEKERTRELIAQRKAQRAQARL